MPQIAGIIGADPESRSAFVADVTPRTPLLPTQKTTRWTFHDAEIVCAVAPGAPVASSSSGTFVLGRWKQAAASTPQAEDLLAACRRDGGTAVAQFDGYGVAVFVDRDGVAWIGVDTLGLFPIYFHADANRLIFSSSPALLKSDKRFQPEFNIRGLVGNLLTMQMVGGQTLWKNVTRLKPGHALRWKRGEGATEIPANILTPGDKYFGESYEQHYQRFDAALDKVAKQESTGDRTGMLLSGGLDSRLLVSLLRRAIKGPVHGITCGKPSDLEMRIAGRVATAAGWPQHASEGDWSRYPEFAEKHLEHQQLACGFNDLAFWFAGETAAAAGATSLFTGVMGDTVMGGEHISWGFDPRTQLYSYETLFARANRYGFKPDQVRGLLRPEVLGDTLDAALADLRDVYDSAAGLSFQKVWLWDMYHRNRFHLSSLAWKAGHGAWPVIAFAGREMLDLCSNMSADSMLHRRAQKDFVCRVAPDLAALPLDRNSRTNLAPVKYRSALQQLWDEKVMFKYRDFLRKRQSGKGVETRYYFRVYDINNPGWKLIREAAEPHRKLAEQFFDPEKLRAMVPPPNEPITLPDGIIDASKIKTVLGFMLWAGKNLPQ